MLYFTSTRDQQARRDSRDDHHGETQDGGETVKRKVSQVIALRPNIVTPSLVTALETVLCLCLWDHVAFAKGSQTANATAATAAATAAAAAGWSGLQVDHRVSVLQS